MVGGSEGVQEEKKPPIYIHYEKICLPREQVPEKWVRREGWERDENWSR